MRLWIILAGLFISTAAIAAPAQNFCEKNEICEHWTVLAPNVVAPWVAGSKLYEIYFHTLPWDPSQCPGLKAADCAAFHASHATAASYIDEGIAVQIDAASVSVVRTEDIRKPLPSTTFLNFDISVKIKNKRTEVDLSRIKLIDCNGKTSSEITHAKEKRSHDDSSGDYIDAPISFSANPTEIEKCTIDFSRAVHSSSGAKIPPLTFKRFGYDYPEIIE